LDLTERLLPVLSKSRCELGIAAMEPPRKMVQGVDSRSFHCMGITQPGNERVRLVCHGSSPPSTGAAIASSRRISRVASVTLQPAAANGQLFLTGLTRLEYRPLAPGRHHVLELTYENHSHLSSLGPPYCCSWMCCARGIHHSRESYHGAGDVLRSP